MAVAYTCFHHALQLAVLEAEQKAEEAEAAETSSRKRGNKKSKHQSSQR